MLQPTEGHTWKELEVEDSSPDECLITEEFTIDATDAAQAEEKALDLFHGGLAIGNLDYADITVDVEEDA
jgi:hypothetical protein